MELDIGRLKKHRIWVILLGIFLVAFSMRYITKHNLLTDPDSYWWYQLALYFAGVRTEYFTNIDGKTIYELAYYPTGRVLQNELLVLPFTIGTTFKLLGSLGMPQTSDAMFQYMFFLGPFLGALTAVMAYFVGRELTSSPKAGLIAAVFYSFSYFAMTRNTAQDTGQESLGTLLLFSMLYLFIKSTNESEMKKQISYAGLGGFVFIIAANTWGGTSFYQGLISSSVLSYILISVFTRRRPATYLNVCISYIVFTAVSLLPLLLSVGASYVIRNEALLSFSIVTLFAALTPVAIAHIKERQKKDIDARVIFGGAFIGFLVLLYLTGKTGIITTVYDFAYNFIFNPDEKGITGDTVAYYRATGVTEFKATFGILLLAIPVAGAVLLKRLYVERDFNTIFLILFMLLGIASFRWMIRLSYFMSFILPLFIGIIFAISLQKIIKKARKERTSRKSGKSSKEYRGMSQNLYYAAIYTALLIILVPVLVNGISILSAQKYADASIEPWKDAGEWIDANTPKNALLIHWWDYGYSLQTFAKRRTIVDGGNVGPRVPGGGNRNIDVATMFTSPEENVSDFLKIYNPDNLPVYFIVSIDEFGKSGAINYHAKDDLMITYFNVPKSPDAEQKILDTLNRNQISTYFVIDYGSSYLVWVLIQMDKNGKYHPEWSNKVLAKLLPFNTGFGKGMRYFEPVYNNKHVYIYKYTGN